MKDSNNKQRIKEYLINYLSANQDDIQDFLTEEMDEEEFSDFDLLQFIDNMRDVIEEIKNKTKIIIVVNGGVVDAVFSNKPDNIEAILVDWDNINEGDEAGKIDVSSLSEADEEIKNLLLNEEINLNEQ